MRQSVITAVSTFKTFAVRSVNTIFYRLPVGTFFRYKIVKFNNRAALSQFIYIRIALIEYNVICRS